MSIVVAIIGLGLLIVLHEGGHFLVARLCGMRVERFSIGFGPTLLGFERGGTTFQIAPIPLGGFVQITGMNPNEEFDKSDPMVYPNRPRWMRMATILAGPAANYLTAFVLTLFVLLAFGMPSKTQKILEPVAGRPAAVAGLKAGDVLVDANGQAVDADHPITDVIQSSQGKPVAIKVLRDGKPFVFQVAADNKSGVYQVGIQIGPIDARTPIGVPGALKEAVVYPYYASVGILEGSTGWSAARCTPISRGRSGSPSRSPRPLRGDRSISWGF
jgi:regulator of sigma E protease